jgi:hypothetical protein
MARAKCLAVAILEMPQPAANASSTNLLCFCCVPRLLSSEGCGGAVFIERDRAWLGRSRSVCVRFCMVQNSGKTTRTRGTEESAGVNSAS